MPRIGINAPFRVDDFIDDLDPKRQVALDNQIERLNMLTPASPHLPFPHRCQVRGELIVLGCHSRNRNLSRVVVSTRGGAGSDEGRDDLAVLPAELESDNVAEAAGLNPLAVHLEVDRAGAPELQLQDPVRAEHDSVAGFQRPSLFECRSVGEGNHPTPVMQLQDRTDAFDPRRERRPCHGGSTGRLLRGG
jgi:hypothetical protein